MEIFVKEISTEQKQSISRVRSNCKKHKLLQEASWRRERDRIGWQLERVDGRGQSSEGGWTRVPLHVYGQRSCRGETWMKPERG